MLLWRTIKVVDKVSVEPNNLVPVPAPIKTIEAEFERMMAGMVREMTKSFRNQTFKQLNKGTVNKFEDKALPPIKGLKFEGRTFMFADKQVGNFASIFLTLSNRARRKIIKRFSNKRIQKATSDILQRVNKQNSRKLYKGVETVTGIPSSRLSKAEGLKPTTNALILETAQWANRLRDDTLNLFVSNSLRGMAEGKGIDEVIADFERVSDTKISNSEMVARTQIGTFNSLMTKNRAQNLGVIKAIWRTAEDEKVRKCHDVRNGKEFDLDKGLYASCDGKHLLPGIDYNCRCDYELIIPED